jgi:glycosyltransferase involved in cell wall biosynthesis
MLRDHDLICLSITPWETHLPSSGHYLMREFAKTNRVLFVDHPLTLKDCLTGRSDPGWEERLKRTFGRSPALRSLSDPERSLWVLTPPPIIPNGLPRPWYDLGLAVSARRVRHAIRAACRELGFKRPIFWVSFDVPLGSELAGRLGERLVVYHCFDAIEGEPYIARHGERLEAALMRRSDVVFTTSEDLQARKGIAHENGHFVPNGVDFRHFARALDPRLRVPDDLARLPRPVLGYLGNLEARVDFALLEGVARARRDWSIALVGPVPPAYSERLRALAALPNVHALGPRQASAAPAYLKGFDVAMIPFVKSPQTRAIYPLKLNEYLAAGRPVVMTPFTDLDEFRTVCRVADGVTEWVGAIARALEEDGDEAKRERQAIARGHDWAERAERTGRILVASLIRQNAEAVSAGRIR